MKNVLYIILFLPLLVFSQVPFNTGLIEFGSPSPGWDDDNINVSVFVNNKIYGGTEYSSHIVKTVPGSNQLIDLGRIGNIDERRGIHALTTNGRFIFGAAHCEGSTPYLFYIDSNNDVVTSIEATGFDEVKFISDGVFYDQGANKFVFFATITNSGLYFIKWNVTSIINGTGTSSYELVQLISGGFYDSQFIEQGWWNNIYEPVLFIGATNLSDGSKIIWRYNLGSYGFGNKASILFNNNYEIRNFKADNNPGCIWVFPKVANNAYICKLNLINNSVLQSIYVNNWGRGAYDRIYFSSNNSYIFTHRGMVKKSNNKFYGFNSNSQFNGKSILSNGSNTLYSIWSLGLSGYKYYYASISD